ncbi:MAG: hypothetical protein ACOCWG_01105 [bacterium]
MIRKFTIFITILFCLSNCKEKTGTSIFKAIPLNTPVVIQTKGIQHFINQVQDNSKIWDEFSQFEFIKNVDEQLSFIDSVLIHHEYFNSHLANAPFFISLHVLGKKQVEGIYYIKITGDFDGKDLASKLEKIVGVSNSLKNRIYDDSFIYNFRLNSGKEIYFAVKDGILAWSKSSILLESALRKMDSDYTIEHDKGFKKVAITSGSGVDANIYLNHLLFPEMLPSFFSKNNTRELDNLKNFAQWTELDLVIDNKALILNGFTSVNDSANQYMGVFREQLPSNFDLEEVLPAQTSFLMAISISNYEVFSTKLGKYRATYNQTQNITRDEVIEEKRNDFLRENLDREVCFAYCNLFPPSNSIENQFFMIKTKSKSLAKEKIEELIQEIGNNENKAFNEFTGKINIDKEKSYTYYKLPWNLFENNFGALFNKTKYSYYTFVDNYLVCGTSKIALHRFLHANILKKTLENDKSFKDLSDYFANKSNLLVYCNVPLSIDFYEKFLENDWKDLFKQNIEKYKKVRYLGYQLDASNEMIFNNLFLKYTNDIAEDPRTVWETLLDTVAYFKPAFILNHNTLENEIFIQDEKNNIYLVNQAGRVLWKLPIDEKIMSEIYQVDYYKNDKLQILFNTKNQLHLIDRNGNYVERYPVNLRSPATNGLGLFDYELNENYRIAIACQDKSILLYDIEGNILPDWEFGFTDNTVLNEIQHFRIGEKDYIVLADKLKIYILDRRGNTRVKLNENFSRSRKNIFILEEEKSKTKSRLVTTDTTGRIIFVYFDGTIEKHQVKLYSADHFFDFKDVNADGEKDLIFLDKNNLEVWSQNNKQYLSKDFEEELNDRPIYFHFSTTDRKLGVVSKKAGKIYILNDDGEIYPGFPLKGCTPFSIGKFDDQSGNFNLIVGSDNNFLYNYTVQ